MSERLTLVTTRLHGLNVVESHALADYRGSLRRMYCSSELSGLLGGRTIAQINHTVTQKSGTVRGMHFQQPPHAEMKFVTCIRGEVFDVAVDIRAGSPTFLQWHAETLTGESFRTMVIPEGFAHGFQALSDSCEMLYFHTAVHVPPSERGINPLDEIVGISWPREITDLSTRDSSQPPLTADFTGLEL